MPAIKHAHLPLACLLVLGPSVGVAQGICLPPSITAPPDEPAIGVDPEFFEIEAGNIAVERDGTAVLSEGIRIEYLGGTMTAERATYDSEDASIGVVGRVTFANEDFSIFAEDAALNRETRELSFSAGGFDLPKRPARGSAEAIRVTDANILSLTNLSFTTCPEDDVDWELLARELELDSEAGFGTARGVRLRFKKVPILWAPVFTFPIDDRRKSGFLTPQFAERERTGLDVTVPYYFNLAPNYDLMLEPRYMSKRGLQINSDFRYLLPRSSGQLAFEYLPDDEQVNAARRYVNLQHQTHFGRDWQLQAGVEEVSDSAYFEDMGNSLSITSLIFLNRFLDLAYFGPRWSVQTSLQNFQLLDPMVEATSPPYERLPQFTFEGRWGERLLGFRSQTELVNFDRSVGPTGWRADATQELSLRFARGGMYLTPAVALRNTAYQLDDQPPGTDPSLSRDLTISSLDGGLTFERPAGRSKAWTQTLEPRMLYVHVPYQDQTQLPVFDTIIPDFNLVQLFRKYQYVGPDRVADTDQLSIGVTTRLINGSGREQIAATIGQTRYHTPSLVTLPGSPPERPAQSDYVAEVAVNLSSKWNLDVGYQWNNDTNSTVRAETRFEFRPQADRIFGLGYRMREGLLEQSDLSIVWPVGERWRVIGQYSYSLLEKELLERVVGLEYEACCWRLRIVGRRHIVRRTGEADSTISLQLELKGLSRDVTSPDELLDRGILGYRRMAGTGGQ